MRNDMTDEEPIVELEARPFTLYYLQIVPLWDGDAEYIELGSNLQEIIDTIVREKSVRSLIGKAIKPMRVCMIEQEDAIYLLRTQKTFYARERTPVWNVMVPVSSIFSRETILSCMARNAGGNTEKYKNALYHYPQAVEFYTSFNDEIRPVDNSVFVIEFQSR
jgi:hypothetical protein